VYRTGGIAAIPRRELSSGATRRKIEAQDEGGAVTDTQELVNRYVDMWNEPDAVRRRETIVELWSADAVHRLEPPLEVREAAASLRTYSVFEVRGHAELEARVTSAYEQFIGSGEFVFRRRGDGQRVADTVKLGWEMVPASGGEVAGSGVDFLMLDGDGRIQRDYQFIDP
jgi:hypothetical protein